MLQKELLYAALGTGFTCLATVLGAATVFFFRRDLSVAPGTGETSGNKASKRSIFDFVLDIFRRQTALFCYLCKQFERLWRNW